MTTVIAQPKWIGKSTTFWGSLIGLAAITYKTIGPILDSVGVTVPVTEGDLEEVKNIGSNLIVAIGGLAGFGMAIYGRFKAGKTAQPISVVPNAAPVTVTVVKPGHLTGKPTG